MIAGGRAGVMAAVTPPAAIPTINSVVRTPTPSARAPHAGASSDCVPNPIIISDITRP